MGYKAAKPIWKSKMFWVNSVSALIAVLSTLVGTEFIANNPQVVSGLGALLGVLNVVLRIITDEPVYLVE